MTARGELFHEYMKIARIEDESAGTTLKTKDVHKNEFFPCYSVMGIVSKQRYFSVPSIKIADRKRHARTLRLYQRGCGSKEDNSMVGPVL